MESFIGVIVGGLISLAAVLLTLRWNQKLHEDNLREERRKIKEEREFSSKQAAFMSASEALARFLDYYVSLPDRIPPSDGTVPEEITELSVAFTRLHFYCELETIEKLIRLGQMLNEAFGEAIKAKSYENCVIEDIRLNIIDEKNSQKMYKPFGEVDIESFIQEGGRHSARSVKSSFIKFPLQPKDSIVKYLLFGRGYLDQYPATPWIEGRHTFEVYVKLDYENKEKKCNVFKRLVSKETFSELGRGDTVVLFPKEPGLK